MVRGPVAALRSGEGEGEKVALNKGGNPGNQKVGETPPGENPKKPKKPKNPKKSLPPAASKKGRTLALAEVEVRGGTLIVTSFKGLELVRIEGLKVVVDLSEGGKQGKVTFDRASLAGAVDVTDFTSPIEIEGRRMKLQGLEAACGGGAIRGELVIERQRNRVPFVGKLSALGIDVAQLFDGKALGLKSAKVGGEVFLLGMAQSEKSIEGGGRLWVESAVLDPDSDFEKLRRVIEVGGEGEVKLDTAEATFSVRSGVLALEKGSFGSGNLLMKSVGTVRLGGGLNVATRVYLGENLHSAVVSKPIPGRGRLEFARLEGTDWFFRDELLMGTVKAPRVDFWKTGEPVPVVEVIRELNLNFDPPGGDAIGR
jgi:hypothetical protein